MADLDGMITRGNWKSFLTFDGEEILLVKRKHGFTLFIPILLTGILTIIFISIAFLLFTVMFASFSLFFVSTLLLINMALILVTKNVIDWYFHMYVLTTRKILEVWYTPLSAHVINDILLDKVNCTEIDLKTTGFINEMIDMGDIAITFDRPTHQEEFILKDIKSSRDIGIFLTEKLINKTMIDPRMLWHRERHNRGPFRFNEDPFIAEESYID